MRPVPSPEARKAPSPVRRGPRSGARPAPRRRPADRAGRAPGPGLRYRSGGPGGTHRRRRRPGAGPGHRGGNRRSLFIQSRTGALIARAAAGGSAETAVPPSPRSSERRSAWNLRDDCAVDTHWNMDCIQYPCQYPSSVISHAIVTYCNIMTSSPAGRCPRPGQLGAGFPSGDSWPPVPVHPHLGDQAPVGLTEHRPPASTHSPVRRRRNTALNSVENQGPARRSRRW